MIHGSRVLNPTQELMDIAMTHTMGEESILTNFNHGKGKAHGDDDNDPSSPKRKKRKNKKVQGW
jgi:hypothetical protein